MIYDSRPWLKSYDPGVEPECEIPDISLTDQLLDTFRAHADRTAFHYMGMSMSFGELLEQSGRFAAALAERGLGRGDVVAVNLPNIPQYLVAVVGSLRAGCAISGLAPLLTPDEMIYQLNDCGARAFITLDLLFDAKFAGVAHRTSGVELVLVAGIADYLPGVGECPTAKPLAGLQVMAFLDFVNSSRGQPPEVSCVKDDLCFLQYTGGTTGPPKGAILTHGSLIANIYQFDHWAKLEKAGGVWLTGFPMFHMAGLFIASCALAWAETLILIPDPRNVDHIIGEYERHRPNFLANVPSLYMMLLASDEFKNQDFSQVEDCLTGAAPFPVDGIKTLEAALGEGKLVEVWGMTETSPLITVNPTRGKKKLGSVGLPLPSTRLRIVDVADGETEVPLGQEGELICSGPQLMKGYLNKPEETENALREHDGAVWMHTGDVGRMDEDGFVYVVDRAKDMIIVSGYKVFSSEVEDKLYKHPAIEMCALVGIPDPERPGSEIVKLVVQKSEAYRDKPNEDVETEIVTYARDKLAPYKVPRVLEFVESVPLTSVGKVDKKALRG